MALPKFKDRTLLLSSNITQESVKEIINQIFAINLDDDDKDSEYKYWERKPIYLFINSFGGSVYDGLALIDAIKYSKTPVYTVCIGSAMSMGLWVWLSGHRRLIGEHATLMFHDISTGIWDKSAGIKQELEEMLRLQELLINEIVSTTKITKTKLRGFIDRKSEWYIPAQEALDLKLADELLK